MNSRTVTTVLPAAKSEVFAYLAEIENLPEWATDFARELVVVEGRHKVRNGLGEFFFEIQADESTGVIDMLAGPDLNELALFPTRVVELPGGGSAFTFTMFQAPSMPDELFDSQYRSLVRELENVRGRFAGSGPADE